MLGLGFLNRDIALWLIDSLRWMLVLGNIVAIIAGIMLAFFPDRVAALEASGGRWYSARKMTRSASEMKPKLDMLVADHPRAAGGLIALFGLALIGTFGMMVPRIW
jgi:hypothetical protein